MSVPGINNVELRALRHGTLKILDRDEVFYEDEEMSISEQINNLYVIFVKTKIIRI